MNVLNQIAQHLKVEASRITRCEEWAKVWFVVIQGKGARFVSKKVVKVNNTQQYEYQHGKFTTVVFESNGDINFTEGRKNMFGKKLNSNQWQVFNSKTMKSSGYLYKSKNNGRLYSVASQSELARLA